MSANTLQDNGWISVPWAEHVGAHADHGPQGSFGYDAGSSQMTYVIQVGFNDLPQALASLLGTAIFNPASGKLQRTLPARHPLMPYLYARRVVSVQPLKFVQKQAASITQTSLGIAAAWYDRWIVTIGFEVPPYRICADSDLAAFYGGKEYARFTEVHYKASSFSLSREAGTSFKWAEGSGTGGQPTATQPFNSPQGQYLNQDILELRWHRVPRSGVYVKSSVPGSDNYLTATLNSNIQNCRNKLNSTNFLGYYGDSKSGVVRFDDVEIIPLPSPLQPSDNGLDNNDINGLVDVVYRFTMFDPPSGGSYRGHNLAPSPGDSKWYLITADGTATGTSVYGTADLNTLFQLSVT